MRSLAVKIFLAFWLIHALIFVVLALLPDSRDREWFVRDIRRYGHIAAAMHQQHGDTACRTFLDAVEQREHARLAVFDGDGQVVCHAADAVDPRLVPLVASRPDGLQSLDGQSAIVLPVEDGRGRAYTAAGITVPHVDGDRGGPPFPRGLLITAVLVSGIVCFLLARSLAFPLRRMRDASNRLAAGDLAARAGATVSGRHDEVGDLVRAFDAMADRIADLLQSQSQLLSDISHELRSPLARLQVAVELARRKTGPAAEAELARIKDEADRMNELIRQVLTLARAEHDQDAHRREPVDLVALVRSIVEDAAFEAARHEKHVTMHEDGEPIVDGDAALLASAIENVVRNAVRHTPANTAVAVEVATDGTHTLVRVRDHGPGVPDAELERIFDPFHRVGSDRTRASGGAGLGLAIARRAVTLHGGTITARNHDEGGLDVRIHLPGSSDVRVRP